MTITAREEIRNYFAHLHDVECNQKYNKTLPYSFHLDMVYEQGVKFKHLIPLEPLRPENIFCNLTLWDGVVVGLYGHDAKEDARLTHNDIREMFGVREAEIIHLCTEWMGGDYGRTRATRHPIGYWQALATDKLAVFVKLCDVIANVKFSLLSNSSMFKKYREEYRIWRDIVYLLEYNEMFEYLESLFAIKQ